MSGASVRERREPTARALELAASAEPALRSAPRTPRPRGGGARGRAPPGSPARPKTSASAARRGDVLTALAASARPPRARPAPGPRAVATRRPRPGILESLPWSIAPRSADRIERDIETLSGPDYTPVGRGDPALRVHASRTVGRSTTSPASSRRSASPSPRTRLGTLVARNRPAGEPVFGIGSHCDSNRNGGRYDGTMGVVTALEVCRLNAEHGLDLPLQLISFLEEEGSGFGQMLLGSRIMLAARHRGGPARAVSRDRRRPELLGARRGGRVRAGALARVDPRARRPHRLDRDAHRAGPRAAGHRQADRRRQRDRRLRARRRRSCRAAATTPARRRWTCGSTRRLVLAETVLELERLARERPAGHGRHRRRDRGRPGADQRHRGSVRFSLDIRGPEDDALSRSVARADRRVRRRSRRATRHDARRTRSARRSPATAARRRHRRRARARRGRDGRAVGRRCTPAPPTTRCASPSACRARWCSCPARTGSATTRPRRPTRPTPRSRPRSSWRRSRHCGSAARGRSPARPARGRALRRDDGRRPRGASAGRRPCAGSVVISVSALRRRRWFLTAECRRRRSRRRTCCGRSRRSGSSCPASRRF